MRVPSIGLTREERVIIREGYRIAEAMLRDYRDPPSAFAIAIDRCRTVGRQMMQSLSRVLAGD